MYALDKVKDNHPASSQLLIHAYWMVDDRWLDLHGGGFASAVVSEERGDLAFVEVQT